MKTKLSFATWMPMTMTLALVLAGVMGTSGARAADEKTAFELIKEGNKYVGEQAEDKVVELRSDKSVGSLQPNIWHIVYYDSTATFNAVEVKFGAGKMLDVNRPMRLLEPISGGDKQLDRKKMKIDSDEAIELALKEPLIEGLTIKATRLKSDRGEDGTPIWKIDLWAAKLNNPNRTVGIGELHLSMEDGKVVKNDLKIGRVD